MYICADYPYYTLDNVCLLLALPSINFQFKQLFFILVILLSDKTFSWDLGRKSDYCGSGINQLGGNSAGD